MKAHVRTDLARRFILAMVISSIVLGTDCSTVDAAAHADFTVARPSTVVQARAGTSAQSAINITNNLDSPVNYTLTHQALNIEDEGRVALNSGSDPIEDAASFASNLTVGANATLTVPITIAIPPHSLPDTHLIGVIVTPTPSIGVEAQNTLRILTYLPIDVTDGRGNHGVDVHIELRHSVVIGTSVAGSYSIYNAGTASVTEAVKATLQDTIIGASRTIVSRPQNAGTFLLPSHHRKTFTFVARVGSFWPSYSHPHVALTENGTNAATARAAIGPSVLVVPKPFLALVLGLLLTALVCVLVTVRRHLANHKAAAKKTKEDDLAADGK